MMRVLRDWRLASALLALAAVVVVGVAAAHAAPSAAGGPDASLDRALAQLVKIPGGPPGVVAVVQRGKRRVVFRHGVGNGARRATIHLGDRWRTASVAKTFNGAVALSLAARGKLSLEERSASVFQASRRPGAA